jgi:hypothetical protein
MLAIAGTGSALAQNNAKVIGKIGTTFSFELGLPNLPVLSYRDEIAFDCDGYPTCNGTYTETFQTSLCTNTLTFSSGVQITGLDLSRPGTTFQGNILLKKRDWNLTGFDVTGKPANCTLMQVSDSDVALPYKGTWDGVQGTMTQSFPTAPGTPDIVYIGQFKADLTSPPPVFPMVVTSHIDNVSATASAEIQFRPQDVGSSQSVFVFAMAPIDRVKDAVIDKAAPMQWFFRARPEDLPVQCVLAQLSASGQLVGVSASTLQAYVTGVLSSQGAAVTILNGVPTVNIGGATFFVGYGTSGQAMLNGGVNRSAVTVPGAQVCQPTAPQTGWWWNPLEDGRGFSVEKHGPNMFIASFLYDASGRSTWFVSSGLSSLEGSLYVGDLLAARGGQTLGGAYPGFPTLTKAGTVTMTFNSATNGTLVWPGGTVPLQRQSFVPNGLGLTPMSNGLESGWWWNESEAGRGFFMEFQGDWLDIAGYMYDEQGNAVWYLTVAQMTGANKQSFSGNWWSFANGQTLTGAWKPNTRTSDHVAPLTITFTGTDSATMTLPNGRSTNLKRHRF